MSVRDELYRDLLITAIEGGIDYWAMVTRYSVVMERDFTIRPGCFALIRVEGKQYRVDEEVFRKGLNLLAKGGGYSKTRPTPDWWKPKWAKAYRDFHEWDYDADDASTVLQAALFGEVVYG